MLGLQDNRSMLHFTDLCLGRGLFSRGDIYVSLSQHPSRLAPMAGGETGSGPYRGSVDFIHFDPHTKGTLNFTLNFLMRENSPIVTTADNMASYLPQCSCFLCLTISITRTNGANTATTSDSRAEECPNRTEGPSQPESN